MRQGDAPNPLDFPRRYLWREVYQGRWTELTRVEKAYFIVEVTFFVLLMGSFVFFSYLRGHNVLAIVAPFGLVCLLLLGFFFLLTRFIR